MKNKPMYALSFSFYTVVVCVLITIAYLGSKAVDVIAENNPVKAYQTVIIDAGHGGIDGGATSCNGAQEKDINLDIALRLEDLMHLLGINTIMIRKEDRSIHTTGETIAAKKVSDLKERVKIVNETQNSFYISIHQNYYPDGRYSGAQVFYSANKDSENFAKALQTKFTTILTPGNNRQAKKASGVYIMEHIQRPGILVECGFLSNYQEEGLLRDSEYQKKICCLIAAQTSEYLVSNTVA